MNSIEKAKAFVEALKVANDILAEGVTRPIDSNQFERYEKLSKILDKADR